MPRAKRARVRSGHNSGANRAKMKAMREAKRARAYDAWMEKHSDEPWSGLAEGSTCPPCGFWGGMGTVGKVIVVLLAGGAVVGVAQAIAGRRS